MAYLYAAMHSNQHKMLRVRISMRDLEFIRDSSALTILTTVTVSSMRKAREAEEASPQEQVGVGEGVWSLATDEEASVVGCRNAFYPGDNSPVSGTASSQP